jgi:Sensors of blue-light using FAD.
MYVTRLIYCSRVTDVFHHDSIADILRASHRHNFDDDITGILCFSNNYFLQCLEGSRTLVNHLYQKLVLDPRHTDLMLLGFETVVSRSFYHWSMAYVGEENFQKASALLLKHSGSREFNPYHLTDEAAFHLLHDLSKALQLD